MAAYAATITVDTPRANRIGNTNIGIISGTCNITNYNQTLAAITAITGKFSGGLRVVAEGASANGYVVTWNVAGSAFKAWKEGDAAGALVQVANDVNVGTFNFIAMGRL